VLGDLRAQVSACAVAERGLLGLLQRFGAERLRPSFELILDQAERLMRGFIRDIPDGRYRATEWIDGLGEQPEPLRIEVCVTVAGDEIEIDFDLWQPWDLIGWIGHGWEVMTNRLRKRKTDPFRVAEMLRERGINA